MNDVEIRDLLGLADGLEIRVGHPLDASQLRLMHGLGVNVIVDPDAEPPCACAVCRHGAGKLRSQGRRKSRRP